jgi:GT2 family glycosyltransferase
MGTDAASVAGVVATYRRPAQLRNLLASLKDQQLLSKVIVVDNGLDEQTRVLCQSAPLPVQYHRPVNNLGCGGGVGRGLSLGLEDQKNTHFCLFDDDAEATPGAVASLLQGMTAAQAGLAVPLIINSQGYIEWFPGLTAALAWETVRRRKNLTPEEYRQTCGLEPVPFTWAPWPALMLSATVVREHGYPRNDFWLCAEDLEYTLRLTHFHKGVMVPTAVCRHLPPVSSRGDEVGGAHYVRFSLMLQNLAYISTRLPHARRAFKHLPGNYRRFLRTFGWNRSTVRDVLCAFWHGFVCGKPAGIPGHDRLKQRFISRR